MDEISNGTLLSGCGCRLSRRSGALRPLLGREVHRLRGRVVLLVLGALFDLLLHPIRQGGKLLIVPLVHVPEDRRRVRGGGGHSLGQGDHAVHVGIRPTWSNRSTSPNCSSLYCTPFQPPRNPRRLLFLLVATEKVRESCRGFVSPCVPSGSRLSGEKLDPGQVAHQLDDLVMVSPSTSTVSPVSSHTNCTSLR